MFVCSDSRRHVDSVQTTTTCSGHIPITESARWFNGHIRTHSTKAQTGFHQFAQELGKRCENNRFHFALIFVY